MGGYAQSFGGISIHALLAESDESTVDEVLTNEISIHALLAESDPADRCGAFCRSLFLSTLSLRRATRRKRDGAQAGSISIHALLAESDLCGKATTSLSRSFLSTLSLRRATAFCVGAVMQREFLSTLSLRRATVEECANPEDQVDFYPRSPCGERQVERGAFVVISGISIHALLAESDRFRCDLGQHHRHFYPRSPCGERRAGCRPCRNQSRISIHALLAESDDAEADAVRREAISIHALLAESDPLTHVR